MLSRDDVRLIRESWAMVVPIADAAATLFYDRMFAVDPRVEALFGGTDMQKQKQKLLTTLGAVVAALDAPEAILGDVRALGVRHARYGVRPADYDTVGGALIWTLSQGLGEQFTPEARAAWTAAYALVAGTMRDAADHAAAA